MRRIGKICVLTLLSVFLLTSIGHSYSAPTKNAHFFGDANGDLAISAADITQHNNYIFGKSYTYDTLQPATSGDRWNTCDLNHDRACSTADVTQMNNFLYGKTVSLGADDPWGIVSTLTSPQQPLQVINFRAGLYATPALGQSGVPGISIEVTIDNLNSTTTGYLVGRDCAGGTGDVPAPAGAQCAIGVAITQWGIDPLYGWTELSPLPLGVYADGNGVIELDFEMAAKASLDLPQVTFSQQITFSGVVNTPPAITLNCPSSVEETRNIVCTYTTTDPDVPPQELTVAVNPATDTCEGSIVSGQYVAFTTEAQGPGSCVVGVMVTDNGLPPRQGTDEATVNITEVNASPTLTLDCPLSVDEGNNIVCELIATDPDIPANDLVLTRHSADTCGGSIVGTTYTASTDETKGPGSCQVVVTVTDNGVPARSVTRGKTITINEVNSAPTISLNCPASVIANDPIDCTITTGDSDIPANTLVCSKAVDDTCGGTLTGCTNYHLDKALQNCKVSINVQDNGVPPLTTNGSANVTVQPEVIEISCANTNENDPISCPVVNNVGSSNCAIGANDTCGGSIDANCVGPYTAPAQGESVGPGSCVAEVVKGLAFSQKTVTIVEENQNPLITVECPESVSEASGTSCTLTVSDADLPPQSLNCSVNSATTCTGVTLNGCEQANIPAQGENTGPGSCTVVIDVSDRFTPPGTAQGSDTITINEENQAPTVSVLCLSSVNEGNNIFCTITASDDDVPANQIELSVDSSTDTCGGTIVGATYTASTTEDQGPGSCVVGVLATDDGTPPLSASASDTVSVNEINQAPTITLLCPLAVEYPNEIVCDYLLSDNDIPENDLTPFVDPLYDTCGGEIIDDQYVAPTEGYFWPPDFCTVGMGVMDDGSPILDGYDQVEVSIAPVTTHPPLLSWTGEDGFISDGVENEYGTAGYGAENAGLSGDTFTFRVTYTSDLLAHPLFVQALVDLNNDGDFLDTGEVIDLTCVGDCSYPDYTSGKVFTGSTVITRGSASYVGSGGLNYRFSAVDGLNREASGGAPVSNSIVTVRHNPAELVALGKKKLEGEPTSGTAGLHTALNYFMEAEKIEDPSAPGTANNYPQYPNPPYPDAYYSDAKFGSAVAEMLAVFKDPFNELDWNHAEWTIEEWIHSQLMPLLDRNIERFVAIESQPAFDGWSFYLNKQLPIIINFGSGFTGTNIVWRPGPGEWDGSEVYMFEAGIRLFRALAEFVLAYGADSVTMADYDDIVVMLEPEEDALEWLLSGMSNRNLLNHIDDDNDGVVDDISAIGRICSRYPDVFSPNGNFDALDGMRLDLIATVDALRNAVKFVTEETDDQSDDIWLVYKDCGLDKLCPGDEGYAGPDEDGSEGNGIYDIVDSNGDGIVDVTYNRPAGGWLPTDFSPAEPLVVKDMEADYDAMMGDLITLINNTIAQYVGPGVIELPPLPEENLIALINDFSYNIKLSLEGTQPLDWSPVIEDIVDLINFVVPDLEFEAPAWITEALNWIDLKGLIDLYPDIRAEFFPQYLPESAQKGQTFMGFVGDFSEYFDPVAVERDGKLAFYKVEPYVALETDPTTGNPVDNNGDTQPDLILGFSDDDGNGLPGIFESFLDSDLNGEPDAYLDLNNDGKWNGWRDIPHNTVPGTNGGIGYYNPKYIYLPDTFLQLMITPPSAEDVNKVFSLFESLTWGLHFFPPENRTPVAPASAIFNPPLITINGTTAMVSQNAGPVTINISARDPDGDPLVFSLAVGHGAQVSTVNNTATITWDPLNSIPPGEQVTGPKVFVVTIYDGVSVIDGWTTFAFTIVVQ